MSQLQLCTAEAFGMGRQHACSDKACGFAAAAAKYFNRAAMASQLMGDSKAHQTAAKDQYRLSIDCCHGQKRVDGSKGSVFQLARLDGSL